MSRHPARPPPALSAASLSYKLREQQEQAGLTPSEEDDGPHSQLSPAAAAKVAALRSPGGDEQLVGELAPKVAELKKLLSGAALKAAITQLVTNAVKAKVLSERHNPAVKAAAETTVNQLSKQLGGNVNDYFPGGHWKQPGSGGPTPMIEAKALLAKERAAAAVAKVQSAQKALHRASARLSHTEAEGFSMEELQDQEGLRGLDQDFVESLA